MIPAFHCFMNSRCDKPYKTSDKGRISTYFKGMHVRKLYITMCVIHVIL